MKSLRRFSASSCPGRRFQQAAGFNRAWRA